MIRQLLVLVAAFAAATSAFSQALPPAGAIPGLDSDRQVVSAPFVRRGDVGWHLWVYTRDAAGVTYAPGLSCPYSAGCLGWDGFATLLRRLNDAPDPAAAFKAAYADQVKFECSADVRAETSERGALCRERQAFVRAGLDTGAAQPMWGVKPNGEFSTRPAYTLADGVRGTREVARATVGARCDVTKPTLVSGSDVWAEFGPDFVPGRVALCGKK